MNTQIWSQWLPTLKGYALAGNYLLEVYGPPAEKPEDYECYIWIPLKRECGRQRGEQGRPLKHSYRETAPWNMGMFEGAVFLFHCGNTRRG
ncbi:MAG: GyrI-like domain-containing protein [Clostridia bacterium]|nr:GyrI-like domain-containing protein [Clostridia bacterium]